MIIPFFNAIIKVGKHSSYQLSYYATAIQVAGDHCMRRGIGMSKIKKIAVLAMMFLLSSCAKNNGYNPSDDKLEVEVREPAQPDDTMHIKADLVNKNGGRFHIDADVYDYGQLFYGKAEPFVPDVDKVAEYITGGEEYEIHNDPDENTNTQLYTIENDDMIFQYNYRINTVSKDNADNDYFVITVADEVAEGIEQDADPGSDEYESVVDEMISNSTETYTKLFGIPVLADRDFNLKKENKDYLYRTNFYNTLDGIPVVDLEGFLEISIYNHNDKLIYINPNRKSAYVFAEKNECEDTITAEDAVRKLSVLYKNGKIEAPPMEVNMISTAYYVSDGLLKDRGTVIPVWAFGYYDKPSHRSLWYAIDARNGELVFDYNTFAEILGIEY